MNTELKAIIKAVMDGVKLIEDLVGKNTTVAIGDITAFIIDLPNLIANIPDLDAEIMALPGSAQQEDLIAYVSSSLTGVTSDAHALAIINASLLMASHISTDAIALAAAIKGK